MPPPPPSTPHADLTAGYPRLPKNIRGHLRRGAARLAADRVRAVITFETTPAGLAAVRSEVTAAWLARQLDAARAADKDAFRALYDRAGEAGLLRIAGRLAAWNLTVPRPHAHLVLAGQMAPGFERYSPGRLLEAALLGRALAAGAAYVDWGSHDHAAALLTASR